MTSLRRANPGNQVTFIDFIHSNNFRRISFKSKKEISENPKLPFLDNGNDTCSYFRTFFHSIESIGEGSFGKVSSAKLFFSDKLYAVKRPKVPFAKATDRFSMLREVMWNEALTWHPNICTFYFAWEQYSKIYIMTELCNTSLDVISNSETGVSASTLWKYMIDILLGLQYIHHHSLIHMDIKPANIFLDSSDTCKIGDFGLVCLENDLSPENRCDGDGKYAAHEVLQDEGTATSKSDMYSFGVTMLELVAEKDLFTRNETYITLRQGNVEPEFLFNMPKLMKSLILPVFSVEPIERPSAVSILDNVKHIMLLRQFKVYDWFSTECKKFDGDELMTKLKGEEQELHESYSKAQLEERRKYGCRPRKLFNNTI